MTFGQFLTLLFLAGTGTGAWNCGSEFSDAASRTVSAVAVIEGRAKRYFSLPVAGVEQSEGVIFRVERVLKGDLSRFTSSVSRTIAVGYFVDEDDPARCMASRKAISIGSSYVVFIGNRTLTSDRTSGDQVTVTSGQWSVSRKKPVTALAISGRPELTSVEIVDTVLQYNCSNCVRRPKSRMSVGEVSLNVGDKLQLHCRTSGRPASVVSWFKDGTPLTHSSRRQVRSSKRNSRLRVKAVTALDFGVYQCMARNVLGVSNVSSCNVWLKYETSTHISHAVPCSDHSFCLNGGACFILTPLGITFCQCKLGFEGARCEEKHTGISAIHALGKTNNLDTDNVLPAYTVSMATGAMILSVSAWCFIAAFAVKRLCLGKTRLRIKAGGSYDPLIGSSHLVADDASKLIQPSLDLPRDHLLPSGDMKRTVVDPTGTMSDPCASDSLRANQDIPMRLTSSASSLLNYLVASSFRRRQRLQAVSGSFECDESV